MDYYKKALELHEKYKGKIDIKCDMPLNNREDLAVAYTPGVAQPCLEIAKDPENAYKYTSKGHLVAIVTDGSAVLGLGNIGGMAGMPVMEGKAALFKRFGGVDGFPICLSTQNTEEIIAAVRAIAPTFGGINLEDISAPRCFEIEERLEREGNYMNYQQALDNCPEGWRLPTDDDWKELERAVGVAAVDALGWRDGGGLPLMSADGLHLTLLGALHAISTAAYKKCNVGDQGYYWTATIDKSMAYECAYIRKVMAGKNQVMRNSMPTRRYAMVRYVR